MRDHGGILLLVLVLLAITSTLALSTLQLGVIQQVLARNNVQLNQQEQSLQNYVKQNWSNLISAGTCEYGLDLEQATLISADWWSKQTPCCCGLDDTQQLCYFYQKHSRKLDDSEQYFYRITAQVLPSKHFSLWQLDILQIDVDDIRFYGPRQLN